MSMVAQDHIPSISTQVRLLKMYVTRYPAHACNYGFCVETAYASENYPVVQLEFRVFCLEQRDLKKAIALFQKKNRCLQESVLNTYVQPATLLIDRTPQ